MMSYIPLLRIVVDSDAWMYVLMALCVIPVLYACYWIWFGLTIKMARKRHRDPLGWVILSLFITPIWVWIILLIAGDKGE